MAPLFLVLTLGLASTGKASELYTCRLLAHQVHCQKIETLKTNETYQLRLCINNKCSAKVTFSFRCCAICEACKTILASGTCTMLEYREYTYTIDCMFHVVCLRRCCHDLYQRRKEVRRGTRYIFE